MYIAASFPTATMWKQSQCPLTDERIKKMRYLPKIEHYAVFKRKEILACAVTFMTLEDIILSELSQSQKD